MQVSFASCFKGNNTEYMPERHNQLLIYIFNKKSKAKFNGCADNILMINKLGDVLGLDKRH